jgi:3-hydroxymyristoyl/3-hydroxydecanoyl-(acyl carrier protein) dehydratase
MRHPVDTTWLFYYDSGMKFADTAELMMPHEQQVEQSFLCFNRQGLETILPHRGAALRKIDAVFYSHDAPNRMIGIKEVWEGDQDLDGHFPGAPTYPGYAQDEFVCLIAAALIPVCVEGLKTNPHVVQKVARYKKNVLPGDQLIAEVVLDSRRGRFFMFSAEIRNQNSDVIAVYEKIVGAV